VRPGLPAKTIDQKKRAVDTRPFGREAMIIEPKSLTCESFLPQEAAKARGVVGPSVSARLDRRDHGQKNTRRRLRLRVLTSAQITRT